MASFLTSQAALERRRLAAAYATGIGAAMGRAQTRELAVEPVAPDELLALSDSLGRAADAGLREANQLAVAAAEVQLLAGAALDLLMAGSLAEPPPPAIRGYGAELTPALAGPAADLAQLQAVIAAPEAYLAGSVAGRNLAAVSVRRTRDLPSPAVELETAVHATLASIRGDVVTTGAHVIEGLLLLDAAVLREALVAVGGDLAGRLGVDLAGLGAQALRFVLAANEKLLALLGPEVLREARRLLETWIEQLRQGTLFPRLADRILRTRATEAEVRRWLAAYQGPEDALWTARDAINLLAGHFAAKARLADKVAAGLAVAKVLPPLLTPAGRLAVAAAYLILLAYLVGSGYDHVDSDRIRLLDRVEGVRGISRRLFAP
ncbi:MAG: hypothetical protein N2204_01930 [Anaerolineae bacterium]|nr:hypothetical protein [Anaerolineae bacterium]